MNSKFCLGLPDYLLRNQKNISSQIKNAIRNKDIPFIKLIGCKDYWARDFMPVQRFDGKFVIYRYYPNYLKNSLSHITEFKKVELISEISDDNYDLVFSSILSNQNIIQTDLIIDGGNVIKAINKEGERCVIMTQKVLFENRSLSNIKVLTELEKKFGAKVILIPWDKTEPYGHADGMVRFIKPGHVLLSNYSESDKALLDQLLLSLQNDFYIYELKYGNTEMPDSWCHINFLDLGKIILIPGINSPSDQEARKQIAKIYNKSLLDCIIIKMPEIVKWGGALNCISWTFKLQSR